MDPLSSDFPWNSCYAFSENSVVQFIELEGLEKASPRIAQRRNRPIFHKKFSGGGVVDLFGGMRGKYFRHNQLPGSKRRNADKDSKGPNIAPSFSGFPMKKEDREEAEDHEEEPDEIENNDVQTLTLRMEQANFGFGEGNFSMDLRGFTEGSFEIEFNTVINPDRMIITDDEGNTIFDSGFVSGELNTRFNVNLVPDATSLNIKIVNEDGETSSRDTNWNFKITARMRESVDEETSE